MWIKVNQRLVDGGGGVGDTTELSMSKLTLKQKKN